MRGAGSADRGARRRPHGDAGCGGSLGRPGLESTGARGGRPSRGSRSSHRDQLAGVCRRRGRAAHEVAAAAARAAFPSARIVLRGDSTLRGHVEESITRCDPPPVRAGTHRFCSCWRCRRPVASLGTAFICSSETASPSPCTTRSTRATGPSHIPPPRSQNGRRSAHPGASPPRGRAGSSSAPSVARAEPASSPPR